MKYAGSLPWTSRLGKKRFSCWLKFIYIFSLSKQKLKIIFKTLPILHVMGYLLQAVGRYHWGTCIFANLIPELQQKAHILQGWQLNFLLGGSREENSCCRDNCLDLSSTSSWLPVQGHNWTITAARTSWLQSYRRRHPIKLPLSLLSSVLWKVSTRPTKCSLFKLS